MPLVGASGAVAALTGAFLVRFPKMKIEMALYLFYVRFRFKTPAYALLPLWLAVEFFYGPVSGTSSPGTHWAHVGATWLEMARSLENQQHFERAADEYQPLADTHPAEKQSILALVPAAGRLYLKRLHRPQDALNRYEKANVSKVAHMDWQPNIDGGIADAKAAMAQAGQLAHQWRGELTFIVLFNG